jgi:hypothetical protein
MARARTPVNPYSHRLPKPKVLDLIGLLTSRQKARYRRLSRSLKHVPGVHAELNYYGSSWGWALRYRRGDATLCTLHFLPSRFETTVTVTRALDKWAMSPNHLSRLTKKDLRSLRPYVHAKMLRMPLHTERRAVDLIKMVRYKVAAR